MSPHNDDRTFSIDYVPFLYTEHFDSTERSVAELNTLILFQVHQVQPHTFISNDTENALAFHSRISQESRVRERGNQIHPLH